MCGTADVPAAFIVDPAKAKHARLFEPAAVSLVSVSEYRGSLGVDIFCTYFYVQVCCCVRRGLLVIRL